MIGEVGFLPTWVTMALVGDRARGWDKVDHPASKEGLPAVIRRLRLNANHFAVW